jgi:hypothetical protein
MALRSLFAAVRPFAAAGTNAYSSAPTVFDKMVQVFVIDKSGVRHTVRGFEGSSLASTLQDYGQFGGGAFMPNVFEPGFPDCHVRAARCFTLL